MSFIRRGLHNWCEQYMSLLRTSEKYRDLALFVVMWKIQYSEWGEVHDLYALAQILDIWTDQERSLCTIMPRSLYCSTCFMHGLAFNVVQWWSLGGKEEMQSCTFGAVDSFHCVHHWARESRSCSMVYTMETIYQLLQMCSALEAHGYSWYIVGSWLFLVYIVGSWLFLVHVAYCGS